MAADPNAIPFTFGAVAGTVAPAGMMIPEVTVTLVVSLLLSVTNTGDDAGAARATWNVADWPGATVTLAGSRIPARFVSEKKAEGETPLTDALTM